MKEILKEILSVNKLELLKKPLTPRETGITLGLNKIQGIIGPRRVGKTSAMLLALKELNSVHNIPTDHLFYLSAVWKYLRYQYLLF